MSGHSKWSTIKHKKGAIDAKRGKLFSKLAKLLITAARNGGGDPDSNLPLRYAMDKAKAANMTKDTIERAIKKGTGELEGARLESLVYEGYAPGGVAVMIEVLTDSRNRTAPEIKKILEGRGGSLGATHCVAWMFSSKGLFRVDVSKIGEDRLLEIVLDGGADDMRRDGSAFEITCDPTAFHRVQQALEAAGIEPDLGEIRRVPSVVVKLDKNGTARVLQLLEELEDHDDVQNVYSNFDADEKVLEELASSS
jgi:YebC/PmpR family DNA-binding regulatory protein